MTLQKLASTFTVCKVEDISNVDFTNDFLFLAKTDDEISLVCKSSCVPPNAIAAETNWKALKILGVLDFGIVGVIAEISDVLAKANIAVFVISTFNTDYILLKADNFEKGAKALAARGYIIK